MRDLLDRADDLQEQAKERLRAADHEGERRSTMVMMLFESTPRVPNASEAAAPPAKATRARVRARATRS
jgi:hypothetical protein